MIQTSTISFAVNGRQYVSVLTGDGQSGTGGPLRLVDELKPPRGHNAVYVFALPERPESGLYRFIALRLPTAEVLFSALC